MPRAHGVIAASLAEGIAQGVQNYQQAKKMQLANETISNPQSTPIQKAMALASIGQEKLGSDVYKGSLREAETAALAGAYGGGNTTSSSPVTPSRTSWSESPPIRDAGPASEPQPGEQGTPSQRPFTVGGPSMAARNPTAIDSQMPNVPPMRTPAPNVPQGAPQGQEGADPIQQAAAMRQQAGQMNIIRPGSGNALLSQADAVEKNYRADIKAEKDMALEERKERMDIHKSFDKEDKAISTAAKQARGQIHAFDTMKKNIATGKLTPTNFTNLTRKALENTRWKDFFLNPEQAEFQAATLETYEGMKEMFGGKITDADLRLASGKVPDLNKPDDANLAIIDFLEFKARMKEAEAEIGDEIKDENGGYRPINYTSQIRKRMQERFGQQAEELTRKAAYDGEVGPKFDIANPEHKARRDAILKSVNGDQSQAEKLLLQEFIP